MLQVCVSGRERYMVFLKSNLIYAFVRLHVHIIL